MSQYAASANSWTLDLGIPIDIMICAWYLSGTDFAWTLDFLPLDFEAVSFVREVCSMESARALISSGVGIFSKLGPNCSISRTSLSAQAYTYQNELRGRGESEVTLIGIPVQWYPRGKRTRFPCIRS